MMAQPSRRFTRKLGERRYHKLFLVATEGAKTEPQYFKWLNREHACVQVIKVGHDSDPLHVLKRMKDTLAQTSSMPPWEAWLVVDKDQWTDDQLAQLHAWALEQENHGFALSNPAFEFWLLLHFEDGTGITRLNQCVAQLKKHLPAYDKKIDISKITLERVNDAIRRAKARDNPPSQDWPRTTGTTVYRLAENILRA